jgi:putative membrane protein
MTERRTKPVVIEMEGPSALTPAAAPPVPEADMPGAAPMPARVAGRGRGPGAFFLASALSLVTFLAAVAAWNVVTGLLGRHPLIGWTAAVLFGVFLLAALLIVLREVAAIARLARTDRLRQAAGAARDLPEARRVSEALAGLYAGRADVAWGRDRLKARIGEVMDAETLLHLTESELLAPLDREARREIERAARQVAAVTALVPLALADVAVALLANVRMIRRIAALYGGRSGFFVSWRLLRSVMTHLVATGAVAAGDDLIQSVAGGGLLSKLSRRFGEGVINAALTARVGVAALEVCRPMPFAALPRPKVTNLVSRGLAGLFGAGDGDRP